MDSIIRKLRENRILREKRDYDAMSLNDVIALCQEGDQLAITYLLKEYEPLLNKLSNKFILDTQDDDDLYQIASIGFWDAIMKWDPEHNKEGGFVNHVKLFVTRKLTDELRKDSAEKSKINTTSASLDEPTASDDEGGEITLGATLPAKGLNPHDALESSEGVRSIMDFIKNELSEAEREVILMKIDGYKVSEIAEETGMKYKSVENALKRVKDKLAERMRARESRSIREDDSLEFSDEEKQILRYAFDMINEEKSMQESSEPSIQFPRYMSNRDVMDIIDELGYSAAVEIKGNTVYADDETLRQLERDLAVYDN